MSDSTKRVPGCCPDGVDPAIAHDVYRLVRLGSPKLALSVASGIPLTPGTITITGQFTSVTQQIVKEANPQTKVDQDTLVEWIDFFVQHTSDVPGGIDSINNYFFMQTSGIQATIKMVGPGGGYNPVVNYTPLYLIKQDLSHRPWLYTIRNSAQVDLVATVSPLPFTCDVSIVLKGVTSPMDRLFNLDPYQAVDELNELGYCVQKNKCYP